MSDWALRAAWQWGTEQLVYVEPQLAESHAQDLLLHVSQADVYDLIPASSATLTADQWSLYQQLIKQRKQGRPLQYMLGSVPFMDAHIEVNEHVLIPRPETEQLCDRIVESWHVNPPETILDICTGSGAIAIALAKHWSESDVLATDISSPALAVAKRNARLNACEQIRWIHSDVWQNVTGNYDLIVSNPPYVSDHEMDALPLAVKQYEPHLALASGRDGGDVYRRLLAEAALFLNPGGWLTLEIGEHQAELLQSLAQQYDWPTVEVKQDYQGKDRFVFLSRMEGS